MNKVKLLAGAPNEIVVERTFDAPRRLVLEAMRRPDLLKRWLGGKRATVESVAIDLRVGGKYRYVYRRLDGHTFSFSGVYSEVSDARVVHTERFDDSPPDAIVTTLLVELGNKTTLTITIAFDSAALRDMVLKTGMAEGMSEAYDALEAVLGGTLSAV